MDSESFSWAKTLILLQGIFHGYLFYLWLKISIPLAFAIIAHPLPNLAQAQTWKEKIRSTFSLLENHLTDQKS